MRTKALVSVLAVVVVLSTAAAHALPAGGTADPIEEPTTEATDLAAQMDRASGSSAASSSSASGSAADASDGNYTRLYVDSDRGPLRLEPGESEELTVVVKNAEDEAVSVDPHLYVPPMGERVIDESWVEIDGPTAIDAGEEVEYDVTVSTPEDAEIGYYSGQIAVTDESIPYPGRPARPIHAARLRVEVWQEPVVQVHSRTYVHGQVEAGDSITHEVVVENTGDRAVPMSPELAGENRVCHGNCPGQFDASWVEVDAPSDIAPGETATVSVTVAPPEVADPGRYRAQVDLGLKDPNRGERDTRWQEVSLDVEVWSPPDEPFETAFDVSERADDVTLTLSPRAGPYRSADGDPDPVSFDVELVAPDGSVVEATRVQVSDRGSVDMSGERRPRADDGDYAVRGGGQEFVYRVEDPPAGTWTLRVMPENAIGFTYEITRDESG